MVASTRSIIPIYTSRGDAEAFLVYPYLYNRQGEWIGFVAPNRDVYSVLGYYVGYLTNDPRILRKSMANSKAPVTPLSAPSRINVPPSVPLPKMMSELTTGTIDVLEEEPERLHTRDSGELLQDLD